MDSKSGIAPAVDTLFVWDFDWTIVNCNSDEYVPSKFLGDAESERKLRRLYRDLGPGKWHECVSSLVNSCVEEKGCSRQDVIEAAASMPYLVDVEGSVRDVAARAGCSQMIISDGNDKFIGAFLDRTGLGRCFDRGVETNFATWSAGRFGVRHQSSKYGGHSSPSCPPNLCKSQVLRDVLGGMEGGRPRLVYVGDGSNDACPALRVLVEGDALLARDGRKVGRPNSKSGPQSDRETYGAAGGSGGDPGGAFPILSALRKAEASEGLAPRCRVLTWNTGGELRSHIRHLLDEVGR